MAAEAVERRLTAILAADIAGYSGPLSTGMPSHPALYEPRTWE